MPLKTPKTKSEGILPKGVEGDTFYVKATPSQQPFPKGLTKILLGISVDPILKVLERADRELSENMDFYPLWCVVFETCRDT